MKLAATVFAVLLVSTAGVGSAATTVSGGGDPLADAGLDQEVTRGTTVLLDGTGSRDPGGRVVTYDWQIETPGGRTVGPVSPGAGRTRFVATEVGRYRVTLTVTDDEGNTASDTLYVDVEGTAPSEASPSTAEPTVVPEVPQASATALDASAPSGPSCPAGSSYDPNLGACLPALGSGPDVDVDGPPTTRVGEIDYYTARATGFSEDADLTYDWATPGASGRSIALQFDSPGTYTVEVTASDGETAVTDERSVYVAPEDNERPRVEIARPDAVAPGEQVTLSTRVKDDPDGFVVGVEWEPSSTVTVPDDGSSVQVGVTVTDDDGASVSDFLVLRGEVTNESTFGMDTTDVTCYYSQETQRRNDYAPRCLMENGETAADGVGPSQIRTFQDQPKIDLHWRKLSEDRIDALRADDTNTSYGTEMGDLSDRADRFGFSDDLVRQQLGTRSKTSLRTEREYKRQGKSISDDLNGDGNVDIQDWNLEYTDVGESDSRTNDQQVAQRAVQSAHGRSADEPTESDQSRDQQASASAVEDTTDQTYQSSTLQSDRIAELNRGATSDRSSSESTETDSSPSSSGSTFERKQNRIVEDTNSGSDDADDDDSGSSSGSSGSDTECRTTQGGFSICY